MSYNRSVEDKRRGKKHINKRAKMLIPAELPITVPPEKEWKPVGNTTMKRAKQCNIPVRRKGGMWFVPTKDYPIFDLWW